MKKRKLLVTFLIAAFIISFAGFILSFDYYMENRRSSITHFSTDQGNISFTVETVDSSEPPAPTPTSTSTSAGGGGGGGVILGVPDFRVSPRDFNVKSVSGRVDTQEIEIENIGMGAITVDVFVTGLENYVGLESSKITLNSGEKKKLTLTLTAGEPGVFTGKIIFKYQGIKREVLVLFNVISDGVLFDVSITIPENYKRIKEGQKLPALIELVNIGSDEGLDATLNYLIKDFDGNLLYSEAETLFVQGTKTFNKEYDASQLKEGDYVAGVELIYPGGFGSASAHFEVFKVKTNYMLWLALLVLIIAIAIVIYAWKYYKKKGKNRVRKK